MFYLSSVFLQLSATSQSTSYQLQDLRPGDLIAMVTLFILTVTFIINSRERRRKVITAQAEMCNAITMHQHEINEIKADKRKTDDEFKAMVSVIHERLNNFTDLLIKIDKKL